MSYQIPAVLVALLLAGCATTPNGDYSAGSEPADQEQVISAEEGAEVVGADKSKWICKREKMTGSNRIERICYTRQVAKDLRERTQDGMFRRVRNTACTDCSSGG